MASYLLPLDHVVARNHPGYLLHPVPHLVETAVPLNVVALPPTWPTVFGIYIYQGRDSLTIECPSLKMHLVKGILGVPCNGHCLSVEWFPAEAGLVSRLGVGKVLL